MNILKAMKRSSLGLDLYLWLTYRTFALKRPLRLSWARLYRQFGADPAQEDHKLTVNDFRKDCLRELKKIKISLAGSELLDGQGGAGPFALTTCCTSPCDGFGSWSSPQVPFAGPESLPGSPRRPPRGLFLGIQDGRS